MGEVVYIDFKKQKEVQAAELNLDGTNIELYAEFLRVSGLDEDDVQDILGAIECVDEYNESDEVVQQFANIWFNYANAI